MLFLKRTLPLIICFILGITFFVQYYVPHKASEKLLTEFSGRFLPIIGAGALILGVMSIINVHWQKIKRKAPGWMFSVIVLFGIIIMVYGGIVSKGEEVTEDGKITFYGWLYYYALVPLQGTMFAILGFFVASAAFRAFRIKTALATVLMISALIVLLGYIPLGETIWAPFRLLIKAVFGIEVYLTEIAEWIMGGPNMAARRAIYIGITLGMIAMSLKVIFGLERAYLGGKE